MVLAGVVGFAVFGGQSFSSFDFQDCSWHKVEINGTVYTSKSDLKSAVIERSGQEAWNEIKSNVDRFKVENGALFFKPGDCAQTVGGK